MNEQLFDPIELVPEAKLYARTFVLWPKQWKEYSKKQQFNFKWKEYPFTRKAINEIPNTTGVYTIVIKPKIARHYCSYLMYIGIAKEQTLHDRIRQYFTEKDKITGRPKVRLLLKYYDSQYIFFCCAKHDNPQQLDKIEEDLLEAFLPPVNDRYPAKVRVIMKAFQ